MSVQMSAHMSTHRLRRDLHTVYFEDAAHRYLTHGSCPRHPRRAHTFFSWQFLELGRRRMPRDLEGHETAPSVGSVPGCHGRPQEVLDKKIQNAQAEEEHRLEADGEVQPSAGDMKVPLLLAITVHASCTDTSRTCSRVTHACTHACARSRAHERRGDQHTHAYAYARTSTHG